VNLERFTHQILNEVDLGPGHRGEGNRIDDDNGIALAHDKIVAGHIVDKVESVLESGSAAAYDRHAKGRRLRSIPQQHCDSRGRLVAKLDSGLGGLLNGCHDDGSWPKKYRLHG
jgi:hypothetical protein